MIAVDTNIIIRLLTHDDEEHYQKAFAIFKQNEVFITDTVILETEWVLRYAYKFSTDEICEAFKKLFGLRNVHLSNPNQIAQAIAWHNQGMVFSDALHLAQCQQCEKFYTFDSELISKAKEISECEVLLPREKI